MGFFFTRGCVIMIVDLFGDQDVKYITTYTSVYSSHKARFQKMWNMDYYDAIYSSKALVLHPLSLYGREQLRHSDKHCILCWKFWVWNDMGLSKWWQCSIFGVNCSFKFVFLLPTVLVDALQSKCLSPSWSDNAEHLLSHKGKITGWDVLHFQQHCFW